LALQDPPLVPGHHGELGGVPRDVAVRLEVLVDRPLRQQPQALIVGGVLGGPVLRGVIADGALRGPVLSGLVVRGLDCGACARISSDGHGVPPTPVGPRRRGPRCWCAVTVTGSTTNTQWHGDRHTAPTGE